MLDWPQSSKMAKEALEKHYRPPILTLFQQAKCYRKIIEVENLTLKEAGDLFGKSTGYVSQLLYVEEWANPMNEKNIIRHRLSVHAAYRLVRKQKEGNR